MRYWMKPDDLGVLVEFYLPKKADYQGPLHACLKNALSVERVRALLRNRKAEIFPTVEVLLTQRGCTEQDWEKILGNIPDDLLGGWSMYEVDGAFIDRERADRLRQQRSAAGEPLVSRDLEDEELALLEERTQVVRLILFPNLNVISSRVGAGCSLDLARGLTDAFMDHPTARLADFLQDHGPFWESKLPSRAGLEKACAYIDSWVTSAGVFVFGYLVWAIADAIGKREKVFWVTSAWSLKVNQIELRPDGGPHGT